MEQNGGERERIGMELRRNRAETSRNGEERIGMEWE